MKNQGKSKARYGFLGFFFPSVGITLYNVWKNERPKDAKLSLILAIISLVIRFIIAAYIIHILAIGIITLRLHAETNSKNCEKFGGDYTLIKGCILPENFEFNESK